MIPLFLDLLWQCIALCCISVPVAVCLCRAVLCFVAPSMFSFTSAQVVFQLRKLNATGAAPLPAPPIPQDPAWHTLPAGHYVLEQACHPCPEGSARAAGAACSRRAARPQPIGVPSGGIPVHQQQRGLLCWSRQRRLLNRTAVGTARGGGLYCDDDVALSPPQRVHAHVLPDLLRKAPRAVFRLLTSFSLILVNCMCCLLC